jgi:hypothetical protein
LFIVKTIEDIGDIPRQSGIYVEKELKKSYRGTWSSMFGSYEVTVPKDKCVKLDELE